MEGIYPSDLITKSNIMRNLMIIVPVVLTFCAIGNGQVKEQFRDQENSSTIVVIKEDNAIDQSVLDEHFDLASMNMNDQIMITTKPDAPNIETATASIDTDIESFFETENFNTAEKDVASVEVTSNNVSTPDVLVETTKKDKVETTPIVNTRVKKATTRAKKSIAKKGRKKKAYKGKKAANKKQYKKKKRKKNKRKKNRRPNKKKGKGGCYSF